MCVGVCGGERSGEDVGVKMRKKGGGGRRRSRGKIKCV